MLKSACTSAAKLLGNTPTVCRNSYVHPAIVATYLDARSLSLPKARATSKTARLDDAERRVLRFLERDARIDRRADLVRLLEKSVA
jgi:DNA topoisomerase-1